MLFMPQPVLYVPSGGAYTQTLYDTNDTAWAQRDYTGAQDQITGIDEFEMSVWLNYSSVAANDMIFNFRNGSYLQFVNSSGDLRMYIESSDGSTDFLLPTTLDTTLSSGTLYHLYWYVNTNNGTLEFRIDGSSDANIPDDTWDTTPSGDTLYTLLDWSPFCIYTGAQVPDLQFGDFWLETNAGTQRGLSTFYNSGTPPDLSTLGVTPDIWIGGDLSVSDLNSGTQKGDITPWQIGSGTFT